MSILRDYDSYDALGLADLVARGETTPEELLEIALARAEAINPSLNALVHLVPDTAREHIRRGLKPGPLKGVPFLLKDLGAEAMDFPSHNGSRLLLNTRYGGDSNLYQRLKQSGLVIFGRTTAPEGGVGPVTEAAVYGAPTRNPWALDRSPGGSSGGAGAAVAAGVVPAAHGSDGGGSVRIPASCCGLYGMKPTRARLPDGPFAGEGWAGMAMDGFLTRSVRDTAALLDATHGPDSGAPYWAPPLKGTFTEALNRSPGTLRVAYSVQSPTGDPIHPECRLAVEQSVALLEQLGHHVEEATPDADVRSMMRAWTIIVACGTELWVRTTLASRGRDIADGEIEPVAEAARRYAQRFKGSDYLQAVETVHAFGRRVAAFFHEYDVFVTPTLAEPPAEIGRFSHQKFDDFEAYRLGPKGVFAYSPYTAAANATGQPAASIPLHWTEDGLPVGVHFATAFGEDELLVSLSAQLETARPWFQRRPPPCNFPSNNHP